MYERKHVTLAKLYDNHSLTYEQIDQLKTAIAATEVIPLAVYSPYLFLMLRLSVGANSSQRVIKALGVGLLGFAICDPLSLYCA